MCTAESGLKFEGKVGRKQWIVFGGGGRSINAEHERKVFWEQKIREL